MQSQYIKRKKFIVNVIYGILIILMVYVALKYGSMSNVVVELSSKIKNK